MGEHTKHSTSRVELKERIILAAVELFTTNGIKSITMDEIAASLGISKRTLYEVFPDKERAIVEGINMISKHTKPNAKYPQGGIIKQEAPIHISNLNVIDPSTNKPTRIGRKKDEKGNLVRYAKKSGEILK